MSRRILAAFLLPTAALFVGVVLPLGLDNSRHNRVLFSFRAEVAAERYAAEAELALAASAGAGPMTADALPVARTDERAGPEAPPDDLAVYDQRGDVVAASGTTAVPVRPEDLAAAQRGDEVVRWPDDVGEPGIVLVLPVLDEGQTVGLVAMARSDEQLRNVVNRRWINLAVGGGFATLGAVLTAALLSRWVSRPLRRLGAAAAGLGSGQLSTRARPVRGPPEVREFAATFDEMAARIETLVGGQRDFLADVSHQLRTPLTAMRLRLELLEGDVEGAAAVDVAGTLAELRRLSRLLDGLLAMSRAEHSPQPPVEVDVAAVVSQRAVAWEAVARAAGATLSCRTGLAGTATGLVTPGHLDQVLDNLVANGLDAAGAGGRVEVAVSRPSASAVRITVCDDGPGMSPQRRASAFERFGNRAPVCTRAAGGTRAPGGARPSGGHADRRGNGLGLSIVHALVTTDGGTITVDEAPAGGLLVVVEVPAAVAGGTVPQQAATADSDRRPPDAMTGFVQIFNGPPGSL